MGHQADQKRQKLEGEAKTTDAATHTWVDHALESTKLLYRYRRWRSRENFDGNAPPSVGDVRAGGQNTRQDSPLCLRRTPRCFRRDEKGVEMLELHYQYRRC